MQNYSLLHGVEEKSGPFTMPDGVSGNIIEPFREYAVAPLLTAHPEALSLPSVYSAGPTFTALLPNGYVDAHTGYVFTHERRFVRESAVLQKHALEAEQKYSKADFDRAGTAGPQPVAVLSNQRSKNFHHWWADVVSKAWLFETFPPELAGRYVGRWLVNRVSWRFQSEHLALLGLDGLVESPRRLVRGNLLLSTGLTFRGGQTVSPQTPAFSDHLLSCAELSRADRPTPGHRLYISRSKASARRVLDEADLIAALKPLGFVAYNLEDLSTVEKMELFRTAEVVIGPLGAGLTNIAYSAPGALLIELMPSGGEHSSIFRQMANFLRVDYSLFVGPIATTGDAGPPANADFAVNVTVFLDFLQRTLEAHAARHA